MTKNGLLQEIKVTYKSSGLVEKTAGGGARLLLHACEHSGHGKGWQGRGKGRAWPSLNHWRSVLLPGGLEEPRQDDGGDQDQKGEQAARGGGEVVIVMQLQHIHDYFQEAHFLTHSF